ncbi:MAG: hypothetical protein NC217_01305 [Muribaculaceae bacterium]|nr:hypothetical protein [Muribaculaceae bacterium]
MNLQYAFDNKHIAPLIKWGLLLFILILRTIDISQRHELHPDEVYSVLLAQCNDAYYHAVPDDSYSGSNLKSTLTANHPITEDLRQLYADNADAPHAALYYMALRVCLTGLHHWSAESVAWRGGLLNLFIIFSTYLLLWKLVSILWRGKYPALIAGACCAMAFLSPGAADCAMLVREYQLAALAIVWFSLGLVQLVSKLNSSDKPPLRTTYISLTLSAAMALSTGYLNAFFLVISPLLIALAYVNKSNWRFAWSILRCVALCCLVALVLANTIYLGWFNFLLHTNSHTAKAFANPMNTINYGLARDVIELTWTIPITAVLICFIFFGGILLFKHRKTGTLNVCINRGTVPLLIAGIIVIMLVQYTSMLHQPRYSFPFTPLASLIIPVCFCLVKDNMLRLFGYVGIIIYFIVSSLFQTPCQNFGWAKQKEILHNGALFHSLNPNELVILYPALNDTATYIIRHDTITPAWRRQVTLTHKPPKVMPDSTHKVNFNGPVKAYIPISN